MSRFWMLLGLILIVSCVHDVTAVIKKAKLTTSETQTDQGKTTTLECSVKLPANQILYTGVIWKRRPGSDGIFSTLIKYQYNQGVHMGPGTDAQGTFTPQQDQTDANRLTVTWTSEPYGKGYEYRCDVDAYTKQGKKTVYEAILTM